MTTNQGMLPYSRGTFMPESCIIRRPLSQEGAGNAGCRPHPRALRAKKMHLCARKQRQGSQVIRHSLRDGLRLIRALLGVPCSLAAVALRYVPQHLIPASGDRDHTISLVRERCLRRRGKTALSILTSTAPRFQRFVTIAIRPSSGGGMDGGNHIFLENGSNIFSPEGLTRLLIKRS
jgi:hypothetical protein